MFQKKTVHGFIISDKQPYYKRNLSQTNKFTVSVHAFHSRLKWLNPEFKSDLPDSGRLAGLSDTGSWSRTCSFGRQQHPAHHWNIIATANKLHFKNCIIIFLKIALFYIVEVQLVKAALGAQDTGFVLGFLAAKLETSLQRMEVRGWGWLKLQSKIAMAGWTQSVQQKGKAVSGLW